MVTYLVDSLYERILCKHTQDISTKSIGPVAMFSVQVSFVISTI